MYGNGVVVVLLNKDGQQSVNGTRVQSNPSARFAIMEWGGECGGERGFSCPFSEKMISFLEFPSRAGFDTVPGRSVERGGKG